MNKQISVITNFGCKQNCKYCIWKTYNLNKIYQENLEDKQLQVLKTYLENNYNSFKFTISGGGDPLNNIDDHEKFYNNIFNLCYKFNKKVDIHTSYNYPSIQMFLNKYFFKNNYINRIILHRNMNNSNLIDLKNIYNIHNKLRIVYVITSDISISFLKFIERIIQNKYPDIQLSYREYVGNKFTPSKELTNFCKSIDQRYQNGKYIYQKDYNMYIMPNGNVTETFLPHEEVE